MGLRLSQPERALVAQVDAIKRQARQRDKAARPKKVSPVRTEKPEGALRERRPRQKDGKRLQWTRRLPCLRHATWGIIVPATDACHVRMGFPEPGWSHTGKGQKPDDWRTWPGCRECHDAERDRRSEKTLWPEMGLYAPATIASLTRSYQAGQDGPEVVLRAIQEGRR